jgi:ribosome maturation factor RimP
MTESDAPDALTTAIEPVLATLGLDLYDVELAGAAGRARTLRVLVQRGDGSPVDLDAITAATESISPALDADRDADQMLGGAYTLEVSSPGLERPLRRADHWRGVIGERVSVKVRIDGTAERFRATVVSVEDESVVLDVDSVERRVELADVTQARTVFEWGPQDKPGRSRDVRRKRDQREKVSP